MFFLSITELKAAANKGNEGENEGLEPAGGSQLLHEVGIEMVHFLFTHLLLKTNPYGLSEETIADFRDNLCKGNSSFVTFNRKLVNQSQFCQV